MADKYIEFGFGDKKMGVHIGEDNFIASLLPRKDREVPEYGQIIEAALAQPIGTEKLSSIVKAGDKIAIIISDITRPCPSYKLLPYVVSILNQAGVKDEDITIVSGLGSHRSQTEEEHRRLVGEEIYERIKVEDSTAGDFITVGSSDRGTPYEVARTVVEADKRICLGNIDYHYFAGYSGGAKAIVPGVCTN